MPNNNSTFMKDVVDYITSATPLMQVVTPEPSRFIHELEAMLKKIVWQDLVDGEPRDVTMGMYKWTLTGGMVKDKVKQKVGDQNAPFPPDPVEFLASVKGMKSHSVFVFVNYHHFANETNAMVHQIILDLAPHLKAQNKCIIFVNAKMVLPKEVEQEVVVLHHPRPDRKYIETILDSTYSRYKEGMKGIKKITDEIKFEAIESATGMTSMEADTAFALSITKKGGIDPQVVRKMKIDALKKTDIIEYVETSLSLDDIGGLDNMKKMFMTILPYYTKDAGEFHLEPPSGFLAAGHPGVGKSEMAKALGKTAGMPVLRMNVARVFSKFVGDSEQNIDMACRIAESMAPAILWIDEIEKALAGAGNAGDLDSGVTARVFGQFLTWLNEKTAPIFLFATSNNVTNIPPEFLRLGRWDAIFFVDLPGEKAREEIFRIHLRKRKLKPKDFDIDELVRISDGCTGAEIKQIVKFAQYRAFADTPHRHPKMEDMIAARESFHPESVRSPDKIRARREWARTWATPASSESTLFENKRADDHIQSSSSKGIKSAGLSRMLK